MPKNEKRPKRIFAVLLLLLVLIIAAIYILGYLGINIPFFGFAKSNKFKSALKEYNYQAASTVLNNTVSKDAELAYLDEHLNKYFDLCFSEEYNDKTWTKYSGIEVFNEYTKDKVLSKMDETVSRYYNGELSKDDVKKYLSRLGKFSFASEKLIDCVALVNEKDISAENYAQGIALANQGKYQEAVELLKKVKEKDTAHYQAAQEALTTCKNMYGAPKLQEAQNYIDTHQNDSARKILNSLISLFGDYPEAQTMLDGLEE